MHICTARVALRAGYHEQIVQISICTKRALGVKRDIALPDCDIRKQHPKIERYSIDSYPNGFATLYGDINRYGIHKADEKRRMYYL